MQLSPESLFVNYGQGDSGESALRGLSYLVYSHAFWALGRHKWQRYSIYRAVVTINRKLSSSHHTCSLYMATDFHGVLSSAGYGRTNHHFVRFVSDGTQKPGH